MIPWILISIAILIVLIGIAAVTIIKARKEPKEPDYRTWFIMGISWIPLGIALDNPGFWAMGLIFMIIGLANKDKWKKEKKLSELPPKERRIRIIIISASGVLVLLGIIVLLLTKQGLI